MEDKIPFWEVVFLIWPFPQERRQWYRPGVFIINCEHISRYVIIVVSHSQWLAVHLQILESRRNKKIKNKVYLEQQLLNIKQEELKFKKDMQGCTKSTSSVAFEVLIINCQHFCFQKRYIFHIQIKERLLWKRVLSFGY